MKLIQLIILSAIIGACNSSSDYGAKKQANNNKKTIQEMEARINELNQRLTDNASTQEISNAELEALRAELTNLLTESTNLQEQRLALIEDRVKNLQVSINENTVNLSELSLLRQSLNNEKINTAPEITVNIEALSSITARIEALEVGRMQMQTRINEAITDAEARWQQNLSEALDQSAGLINDHIKNLILEERERLEIELDQVNRQLSEQGSNQQSIYSTQARLEQRLNDLEEIQVAPHDQQILTAINQRMYEPCYNELINDEYCLTQAATIRRLGGEFINPLRFERDRAGLLSYLAMSGVTLPSMLENIDPMITPGSERSREIFRRCMEEDHLEINHLIAPQEQWPRLVVLALVMEKADASLNALRNANEIEETISPTTHFVAWWRSPCYQLGISPNSGGNGDHTYGSALDLSFAAQPNQDTFNFYRDFIKVHIWDNDTFGIRYPLQAANLTMRIGVGLGHGGHGNGQMHLGIFSESAQNIDNRMQWTYGSSNHGPYTDQL